MRFRMLGPLQVVTDDGVQRSFGPRQTRVLAALLFSAGQVVPVTRLVDAVWDGRPPATARRQIQNCVWMLRRYVTVAAEGPGYRIDVEDGQLDTQVFQELLAAARASAAKAQPAQAVDELTAALALWRGPVLAGDAGPAMAASVARFDELWLTAVELRADLELRANLELRAGRPGDVVGELSELVASHPLRERLVALFMRALHASGRQAEALHAYQGLRARLADELGADPGAELRGLHTAILRGELPPAGPDASASAGADAGPGAEAVPGPCGGGHTGLDAAGVTGAGAGPGAVVPAPLPAVPRQLPAAVRHFVGRSTELSELTGTADQVGPASTAVMISVIGGAAGVGKTALAVAAARQLAPRFPDGQIFIDLHGFTPGTTPVRPEDALDRLLRALGVPGERIPPELDDRAALFRTVLAGRRMLLLFDNAASERQVAPLLPGEPGCLVLVTSRRSLAGLDNAHPLSLDVLPAEAAMSLFTLVSGASGPRHAVEEIVALCGRLPLAIRTAVARLRSRPGWSAEDLAGRLRDRQQRLTALDPGHRGVIAALDLSYRQLGSDAQRLFRLLGLPPGADIDLHAAAALLDAAPPTAGRLLDDLVDAHLLAEPAPGRYRCHDLVRAHAAQTAAAEEPAGDRYRALTRLCDHYLHVAVAATDVLYPAERHRRSRSRLRSRPAPEPAPSAPCQPPLPFASPAQAADWLDAELLNLLATAGYAAAHGWSGYAGDFSDALERHLQIRARYTDAYSLHSHALAACEAAGDESGQADARRRLGMIDIGRGRFDLALKNLRPALTGHTRAGDLIGRARDHYGLGLAQLGAQDYPPALDHCRQALRLFRELGDPAGEADVALKIGTIYALSGRIDEALDQFERGLRRFREIGDRTGEAAALGNLARGYLLSDRLADALARNQEALALYRAAGARDGEARTLYNLGAVYARLGRYEAALEHHRRSLALRREIGDQAGEVACLTDIGLTLWAAGRPAAARPVLAEALAAAAAEGDHYDQARAHDGLAHIHLAGADPGQARHHWRRALAIFTELGVPEADQVRQRLASL